MSPLLDAIASLVVFIWKFVVTIVCLALYAIGAVNIFRFPEHFLDIGRASSLSKFWFMALSSVAFLLADMVTVVPAVIVTCSWRNVQCWLKVCKHFGEVEHGDIASYNPKARGCYWVALFKAIADFPAIVAGVLSVPMIWRAPQLLDLLQKGCRGEPIRIKIIKHFLTCLFDAIAAVCAIVGLVFPPRCIRLAIRIYHGDDTARTWAVLGAVLVIPDVLGLVGLVLAVPFVWLWPLMVRTVGWSLERHRLQRSTPLQRFDHALAHFHIGGYAVAFVGIVDLASMAVGLGVMAGWRGPRLVRRVWDIRREAPTISAETTTDPIDAVRGFYLWDVRKEAWIQSVMTLADIPFGIMGTLTMLLVLRSWALVRRMRVTVRDKHSHGYSAKGWYDCSYRVDIVVEFLKTLALIFFVPLLLLLLITVYRVPIAYRRIRKVALEYSAKAEHAQPLQETNASNSEDGNTRVNGHHNPMVETQNVQASAITALNIESDDNSFFKQLAVIITESVSVILDALALIVGLIAAVLLIRLRRLYYELTIVPSVEREKVAVYRRFCALVNAVWSFRDWLALILAPLTLISPVRFIQLLMQMWSASKSKPDWNPKAMLENVDVRYVDGQGWEIEMKARKLDPSLQVTNVHFTVEGDELWNDVASTFGGGVKMVAGTLLPIGVPPDGLVFSDINSASDTFTTIARINSKMKRTTVQKNAAKLSPGTPLTAVLLVNDRTLTLCAVTLTIREFLDVERGEISLPLNSQRIASAEEAREPSAEDHGPYLCDTLWLMVAMHIVQALLDVAALVCIAWCHVTLVRIVPLYRFVLRSVGLRRAEVLRSAAKGFVKLYTIDCAAGGGYAKHLRLVDDFIMHIGNQLKLSQGRPYVGEKMICYVDGAQRFIDTASQSGATDDGAQLLCDLMKQHTKNLLDVCSVCEHAMRQYGRTAESWQSHNTARQRERNMRYWASSTREVRYAYSQHRDIDWYRHRARIPTNSASMQPFVVDIGPIIVPVDNGHGGDGHGGDGDVNYSNLLALCKDEATSIEEQRAILMAIQESSTQGAQRDPNGDQTKSPAATGEADLGGHVEDTGAVPDVADITHHQSDEQADAAVVAQVYPKEQLQKYADIQEQLMNAIKKEIEKLPHPICTCRIGCSWNELRMEAFYNAIRTFRDVAVLLGMCFILITVYRIPSLISAVWRDGRWRYYVGCILGEMLIDVLCFILWAITTALVIFAIPMNYFLLKAVLQFEGYDTCRRIIFMSFIETLSLYWRGLSVFFTFRVVTWTAATLLVGLVTPAELVLNLVGIRAWWLILLPLLGYYAVPFALTYGATSRPTTFTAALGAFMLGLVIFMTIMLLVASKKRRSMGRPSHAEYVRLANMPLSVEAFAVPLAMALEAYQLWSAPIALVEGTSSLWQWMFEAAQYAFLLQPTGVRGYPVGYYLSMAVAFLYFLIAGMPLVVNHVLDKKHVKIVDSPMWYHTVFVLGDVLAMTVVNNLASFAVCRTELQPFILGNSTEATMLPTMSVGDVTAPCWYGIEATKRFGAVALFILVYYIPVVTWHHTRMEPTANARVHFDNHYSAWVAAVRMTLAATAAFTRTTPLAYAVVQIVLLLGLCVVGARNTGGVLPTNQLCTLWQLTVTRHGIHIGGVVTAVVVAAASRASPTDDLRIHAAVLYALIGLVVVVTVVRVLKWSDEDKAAEDSIKRLHNDILNVAEKAAARGALLGWSENRYTAFKKSVVGAHTTNAIVDVLLQLDDHVVVTAYSTLFLSTYSAWEVQLDGLRTLPLSHDALRRCDDGLQSLRNGLQLQTLEEM